VALALGIVSIAIKILAFLPNSLEDALVDPHHPLEVLATDDAAPEPAES